MKDDRRSFLKTVGGVSAAVAGASVIPPAARSAQAAALPPRGYAVAHFALELEGGAKELLRSFSGGEAKAPVLRDLVGPGCFAEKHIGAPAFSDIVVSVAPEPGPALAAWIQDMQSCAASRLDGAVLALDQSLAEIRRLEFFDGLITEFGLPPLDAASKDPGFIAVTIQPDRTRIKKGAGGKVTTGGKGNKNWLTSHYRLRIGGLEKSRITRIEALTLKQGLQNLGELALPSPGKIDVSDLVVTVAEAGGEEFYEWFESFVLKGESGKDRERDGVLEIMTPTLKDVIFSVELRGLGIYSLSPSGSEAADKVASFVARMYCQEARLMP